jgi:peroxiredoxin
MLKSSLAAAALLAAGTAGAQQPQPVTWKPQVTALEVTPGARFTVALQAELAFGWHIYALTQPPDQGPLPTRIDVPAGQPFKLAGEVTSDTPQQVFDAGFGVEVQQHEDEVAFSVPVSAAPTLDAATRTLDITAFYQACNASTCLPPVTETFSIPVKVASVAEDPIDPDAVALLARVEEKMRGAQTLEVIRRSNLRRPDGTAAGWRTLRVQVKRPGMYRIEELQADEAARDTFNHHSLRVTDGKVRLTERRRNGETMRHIERTADEEIYVWDGDVQALAGLYVIDDEHPGIGHDWRAHKLHESNLRWLRMLAPEDWNGQRYQVIEWGYDVGYYLPDEQVRYRQKLYIGTDQLVHRVVTHTSKDVELEDRFEKIALHVPLADALFAVPASEEAAPFTPVYRSNFRVGDVLPDFELQTPTGEPISLSGSLDGKKGAIVWLWGFRCGSCHVEYPLLQQMYEELQPQGFTLIGLAGHSPVEPLRIIQQTHGATLPVAVVPDARESDSVYGRYGSGWKTFYVVDADRRIVHIGGYDAKKFRAALAELGIDWPLKTS